jgi:hypothetical protein
MYFTCTVLSFPFLYCTALLAHLYCQVAVWSPGEPDPSTVAPVEWYR